MHRKGLTLFTPLGVKCFIELDVPKTVKAPLGAECEHLMANTYSQIYIQTVFAVDGRLSLIRPEFKEELYKYITGIVRNNKQKLIAINGMPDHVHILIGLKAGDGLG